MTFEVSFPVKTHLIRYLEHKCGSIAPLDIDTSNIYCNLIWSQLEKPEYNQTKEPQPYPNARTLTVRMNKRLSARRRFAMTYAGCQAINAGLDDLFNDHFFLYVDTKVEAGAQKQQSILDFMNLIGLGEEDIPYETLKKRHDRYRNSLQPALKRDPRKGVPLSR